MAAKKPTQTLAQQIIARQEFLERVLPFVSSLVYEQGKELRREVHNWHTRVEGELSNFADFSFHHDGGQSMYGGDDIKVWYHPASTKNNTTLVLDVWWQMLDKCTVKVFASSQTWQKALLRLVKDKEKVVARENKKREKEDAAKRKTDEAAEKLRKAEMQATADAKRLKITA